MAMSSAVGDPPKKGKKMSAGRRAASRLSSGRCGSKTSGFPAQAANQPGLPSSAQPPGRRSVDESAPHRLRKHQHEGSKCQEQNRTEGTKCPRKPLQPPISSGALPRKLPAPSGKLHAGQLQKGARTRMLLRVQKRFAYCRSGGKLSGPCRGVHQGS
jgi:hypothetical protein